MDKKKELLRQHFGYSDFRQGQSDIIDALLSGRDALGIMPTGAGKSLCYQIPALLFDGLTIVISPLISLMKDQVSSLITAGIAAACLNSSLSQEEYYNVIDNAAAGRYKILYVAPERLEVPEFINLCQRVNISLIAVDEAHCISQWGQDFRPSYLKIVSFIISLPNRPPVGAFTATATGRVRDDIIRILALNSPLIVTTGFDRPNLYFSVIRPKAKTETLLKLVEQRKDKAGIIYCSTRKKVDEVCQTLNNAGYSSAGYHAGMSDSMRRENQDDFVYDRKKIMVATNAFGMGIDKSNVSYVIHYNIPKDLESYYQEAGRAGRDGNDAECILLYSPHDVHTAKFLINHSSRDSRDSELSDEELDTIHKRDLERLKQMTFYATTSDCLRGFILKYFSDKAPVYCGNCSNCQTKFEEVDITVESQKILSCIYRVQQKYGKALIADILRGKTSERITRLGLDRLSTYGIMRGESERFIKDIIDYLIQAGYIATEECKYPVLKLTAKSVPILKSQLTLTMKMPKRDEMAEQKAETAKTSDANIDELLFEHLRLLRRSIADREGVPAYVVFSDASLTDMCQKLPANEAEMLKVTGVGSFKMAKYGSEFLNVISEYLSQNPDISRKDDDYSLLGNGKKPKKQPFAIADETLKGFEISDVPCNISTLVARINELIDVEKMKRLKAVSVNDWLVSKGYLKVVSLSEKRTNKYPTEKGEDLGITAVYSTGRNGPYYAVWYSKEAQSLIIDSIQEIAKWQADEK